MSTDFDLLLKIMELNPQQDLPTHLEMLMRYKQGMAKVAALCAMGDIDILRTPKAIEATKVEETEKTKDFVSISKAEAKKLILSEFKANPSSAISKTGIACCMCGKKFNSLTKVHLQKVHNVSPMIYKEACGYAPSQILMSTDEAKKASGRIKAAVAARGTKGAAVVASAADNGGFR